MARYIAVETYRVPQSKTARHRIVCNSSVDNSATLRDVCCRVEARFHRLYGNGWSYNNHIEAIEYMTVEQAMRKYPDLRNVLRVYNPSYAAWRDEVDEQQAGKQKKVGVHIGP